MTGKNLGEILLEQGVIQREALDRALQIQSRRLGEILIAEHLADPVAIARALKLQARVKGGRHSSRLTIDAATLDQLLLRLEGIEDQLATERAGVVPSAALASLVVLRQSLEMILFEPIETLFARLGCVVQQASQQSNKEVDLRCSGAGLVIERYLVDELHDVCLHLLRNSVDHGIELPHERTSAGKSPAGTLKVDIAISGGRLTLSVSDDGRGIDEEAVFTRARDQGFLPADRTLVTREALLKVLFTPGFSTAPRPSALSGRGVGLDVVEACTIRLGGEVSVQSEPGVGATFRVTVPMQCARVSVLPLRAGKEWIAVSTAEIMQVAPSDDSRGLLVASSLFDQATQPPAGVRQEGCVRVDCRTGASWAFDEVGQADDVLVRESSSFAKGAPGVVGGARLQGGRNVLLVDLGRLAGLATKQE